MEIIDFIFRMFALAFCLRQNRGIKVWFYVTSIEGGKAPLYPIEILKTAACRWAELEVLQLSLE